MDPQITVSQLVALRQNATAKVLLLDVREEAETALAAIVGDDVLVAPLSELAANGIAALPPAALDKEKPIVVFCHHGIRSLDVAGWLLNQGWKDVSSLAGGIDDYARLVDPTIARY